MKDKEKQSNFKKGWEECQAKKKQEIEEIHNFILETYDYNSWDKARAFYSAGYRIIDKDSVVLSKEEYEVLKIKEKEKHLLETCMSVWKNGKIDGSKETAEKILKMFEVWEDKPYVSKEDFKRSIADLFGVEIKE